ncbi:MAG: Y-family DNA polymerase [Alphaproteobacteria bacterium]
MPTSRPPARRLLALWLPRLATDRLHRQVLGRSWRCGTPPDAPLAVIAKVRNAMRLVALDECAERHGLSLGQSLGDARAILPALDVVEENPAADHRLLITIADWAERYTPLVALVETDCLVLDITGCAHLFGGEDALLADFHARLAAQGFAARAAVADTPGGALAMARYGAAAVVAAGGLPTALRVLPLAALRLAAETVAAMDRVGLKTIGQIMKAPRAPLAARFGAVLIRRLDQALGHDEEAINPRRPAPSFITERRFAEPISREDDIAATLSSLAASLATVLEKNGQGARLMEFSLFRVDGFVARIRIGASRPIRTPKLVLALFREKFTALGDALDAGFGFDTARLAAISTDSAPFSQIDLTGDAVGEADLEELVDRIGARLGANSVQHMAARESHLPERAVVHRAWCQDGHKNERQGGYKGGHKSGHKGGSAVTLATATRELAEPAPAEPIDRPVRLFSRPEPVEALAEVPDGPPIRFRWRRVVFQVARAEGPERIAAEWWREDGLTRDYFRVEDAVGHRFWLYREGLYGRETATPRWYLHGVFA